jgi:hypothetical protein
MLTWPIVTVVTAGLAPNILAGIFNLEYNRHRIEEDFPDLWTWFEKVQIWINCIVYPLGAIIGIWAVKRVAKQLDREKPALSMQGGYHVLFFGWFISRLTLGLWSISGLLFPVLMNLREQIPGMVTFYTHFFLSLALCGIAAAVYPYFLLTALAVRVYFPALVRNGIVDGPRWRDLKRLKKLNMLHLLLSALVPMLGILLHTFSDTEADHRWALQIASAVGFAGCFLMFMLFRYIEENIDALEKIAVETPRGL